MRLTLPGLFDLQVNGFGGIDFNATDLTSERLAEALERMRATGVTRCLPTLITSSFERFAASARLVAHAADAAVVGIHMEGPYISPADGARGAHPRGHVVPASVDDFRRRQDAAMGRIVLVTLAPEVPGALPLIEHLVAANVRVAIGHTAATPQQLRDAVSAGATLATHLGNGCPQMLPRHPNVIWELLAADAIFAGMIADGHHLPAIDAESDDPGQGAGAIDSRDRRDSRRRVEREGFSRAERFSRAPFHDRRRRRRARTRRPCLAARYAVSCGLQPDARSRDRQHGSLHGPADRDGDPDGVDDTRILSRHDDPREASRRTGIPRPATCASAA